MVVWRLLGDRLKRGVVTTPDGVFMNAQLRPCLDDRTHVEKTILKFAGELGYINFECYEQKGLDSGAWHNVYVEVMKRIGMVKVQTLLEFILARIETQRHSPPSCSTEQGVGRGTAIFPHYITTSGHITGHESVCSCAPEHQQLRTPISSSQRPMVLQDPKEGTLDRTILFDDVYQDGRATKKNIIIQFPEDSGKFYIIVCQEHGMSFGTCPIPQAIHHLVEVHHETYQPEPRYELHVDIIKRLGIFVINCNSELAEMNNASLTMAISHAPSPCQTKANSSSLGQVEMMPQSAIPQNMSNVNQIKSQWSKVVTPSNISNGDITNPNPGEIFLAYMGHVDRWMAGVVLQMDDLDIIGITNTSGYIFSLSVPNCYYIDRARQRLVWKYGFEDGGHLVHQRWFPFMLVSDPDASEPRKITWVPARDLMALDKNLIDQGAVENYHFVDGFLKMLKRKYDVSKQSSKHRTNIQSVSHNVISPEYAALLQGQSSQPAIGPGSQTDDPRPSPLSSPSSYFQIPMPKADINNTFKRRSISPQETSKVDSIPQSTNVTAQSPSVSSNYPAAVFPKKSSVPSQMALPLPSPSTSSVERKPIYLVNTRLQDTATNPLYRAKWTTFHQNEPQLQMRANLLHTSYDQSLSLAPPFDGCPSIHRTPVSTSPSNQKPLQDLGQRPLPLSAILSHFDAHNSMRKSSHLPNQGTPIFKKGRGATRKRVTLTSGVQIRPLRPIKPKPDHLSVNRDIVTGRGNASAVFKGTLLEPDPESTSPSYGMPQGTRLSAYSLKQLMKPGVAPGSGFPSPLARPLGASLETPIQNGVRLPWMVSLPREPAALRESSNINKD
ncbi:hypothetical protein BGZ63DRAFT_461586 [Mariannaea sp. PMI_226]|nr:hypothetical protein BGZ63DRAFT_461586 [Mariannaea sp. PMI_226]